MYISSGHLCEKSRWLAYYHYFGDELTERKMERLAWHHFASEWQPAVLLIPEGALSS